MIRRNRLFYWFFALAFLGQTAWAGWVDERFLEEAGPLPFSLTYDGKTYEGAFPADWPVAREPDQRVRGRIQCATTWTDPKTGLEVRCEATIYPEFDAVEWLLFLTNKSGRQTPLLKNLNVADFVWNHPAASSYELHYAEGSHQKITDFQPMRKTLQPEAPERFSPFGGRSSDGLLPFFNLAAQGSGKDLHGIILGIGWTGQWAASFARQDGHVRVQAGLEKAQFSLLPKETVRTPSVLVMGWNGKDRMAGQNRFRRLLLDHYAPHASTMPLTAVSPHAAVGFEKTTEENMLSAVRNIAAHDLPVDYYWIDAGWFETPGGNWARGVGNFLPDPARFPHGIKPIADAAHEGDMGFLLWFEPERVMPETFLFRQHREWLLAPSEGMPPELQYQLNDRFHLLDLGNPEAAAWLTGTVTRAIQDIGIDAYRNDFNMYPSFYWRAGEPATRQGIREIKYVQALYGYFDALRKQHPGLLIDTCASGGRRIDLEMLKRALILTRSDYLWDPAGQQCHTYGLAQWLPITGIGAASVDRYKCRSGYGSHYVLAFDCYSADEAVWDAARAAFTECRKLAPLFTKDFYPLTPYSTENDVWMAWQYHDPDQQKGVIQAFRRENAPDDSLHCKLHGLKPDSAYTFTNLDSEKAETIQAKQLMSKGLPITLSGKPAAAIFTYEINK